MASTPFNELSLGLGLELGTTRQKRPQSSGLLPGGGPESLSGRRWDGLAWPTVTEGASNVVAPPTIAVAIQAKASSEMSVVVAGRRCRRLISRLFHEGSTDGLAFFIVLSL